MFCCTEYNNTVRDLTGTQLGGGGGGLITGGRHVAFSKSEPMADLFSSIMKAYGVAGDAFGDDGTTPLTGLS